MNASFAQDWAQLNYFKEANAQLLPPEPNENRVVFLGNSITEGWLNVKPGPFDNPQYINRGIGGQTTPQMKIRFWQDVIQLQPKTVVILAGINDIAQNTGYIPVPEIAQNIEEMAELAKSYGIKVVICSVLPANVFPWRPQIYPADKVIELNALLMTYAKTHGHTFLDYYSSMVNDEKGMIAAYTTDGVHCTEAGYRVMEQMVHDILQKIQ
ncbi:MAG TPA: SGNH/GDSL hydrolase family protein [Flavobacteriaceae bacterium]|nr:SGNH/GDSL hydrolase family protein [Flavobacteriaceae bacterium]MCB9213192.1 acylhydrolase [Alteromonas sp.]HPF10136.1 SGNH/GDSL hydrolase family protein [Flavobacteriaceae bacterium]